MSVDHVYDYYADRAQAALAMSRAAISPGVRGIHLELARRYAELAGLDEASSIDETSRGSQA